MKILEKSFRGILVLLIASISIFLRSFANDSSLPYGIAMMLFPIIVSFYSIKYTNYKKPQAKSWYIFATLAISLSIFVNGLFIVIMQGAPVKFFYPAFVWLNNISIAIFLATTIFFLFYSFKDLFKKGYEIGKIDIQGFSLVITVIIYATLFFINFYTFRPAISESYNVNTMILEKYVFTFNNFDAYLLTSIIALLIYVIVYILIEVIIYIFFERNKENKNSRDFK